MGGNQSSEPESEPQNPNWRTACKIHEKIVNAYSNKLHCDVTFLVGKDKEKISSHKFMLSINSSVFAEMFANKPNGSKFAVKDLSPSVFRQLLQYIFTGQIDVDSAVTETIQVLNAAKKYKVDDLIPLCQETIRQGVSPENAFEIFKYAKDESDYAFIETCRSYIQENAETILDSEQFVLIDFSTLCEFLKDDQFFAPETKIFTAVMRWAAVTCLRHKLKVTPSTLRKELGEAVSLIRFPLMSADEFYETVDGTGVLTDSESTTMHNFYSTGEWNPRTGKFLRRQRQPRAMPEPQRYITRMKQNILMNGDSVILDPKDPPKFTDKNYYVIVNLLDGKVLTLSSDEANVFMRPLEEPLKSTQTWNVRYDFDDFLIANNSEEFGQLSTKSSGDEVRYFNDKEIFNSGNVLGNGRWVIKLVQTNTDAPVPICFIKNVYRKKVLQITGTQGIVNLAPMDLADKKQLWCVYPVKKSGKKGKEEQNESAEQALLASLMALVNASTKKDNI